MSVDFVLRTAQANLHDAKRKARLEHCACFVNVNSPVARRDGQRTKLRIEPIVLEAAVSAVRICDAAKLIDAADECANEEQVDERNEASRVLRASIEKQRPRHPCRCQHRDYEQNQDGPRCESIAIIKDLDDYYRSKR